MPAHPLHVPDERTRAMVEMGAALGRPHREIADVLGITVFSLRRHYRPILDTAAAKVHLMAGKVFVQRLKEGDLEAAKYWASRRMGWHETSRTEVTGPDGQPWPVPLFQVSFIDSGPGEPPARERKQLPASQDAVDAESVLLETPRD